MRAYDFIFKYSYIFERKNALHYVKPRKKKNQDPEPPYLEYSEELLKLIHDIDNFISEDTEYNLKYYLSIARAVRVNPSMKKEEITRLGRSELLSSFIYLLKGKDEDLYIAMNNDVINTIIEVLKNS